MRRALFERLMAALEWVHLRWTILRPAVLPLICAIVFAGLVGLTAAGREILYHMAEGGSAADWLRFALGLGALTLFAALVWYTSRALLYVRYAPIEDELGRHRQRDADAVDDVGERWRRWEPRLAGLMPIVPVVIVYAIDWWRPGDGPNPHRLPDASARAALLAAIAALILLAAYMMCRRFLPSWLGGVRASGRHRHLADSVPTRTRRVSSAFLILAAMCVVSFTASKVWLPQFFGTAGVVFLFASCLVVIGAFALSYWVNHVRRLSIPGVLLAVLLVAGLFASAGWTDNHGLRLLADADGGKDEAARISERPTMEQRLAGWLETRKSVFAASASPYPLIVVAAQGGGVRAAMWAAAALGTLQDRDPAFACHLFAIVGISGGAFGALTFDGLLASDGSADCRTQKATARTMLSPAANEAGAGRYSAAAYDVFGSDLLASLMAGMLFPDFVARFLPTARSGVDWLVLPDRQLYLERAVEAAWARDPERSSKVKLDEGLLAATRGSDTGANPVALLVASEVSEGRRWIASEIRVEPGIFVDAVDVLEPEIGRPLPLPASAAAGNSARFPWVSPPGGVHRPDEPWRPETFHLLDGGIVESSGAATAYEILYHLRRLCAVEERGSLSCRTQNGAVQPCLGATCLRIRPIVLQLSNDGYDALKLGDGCPVTKDAASNAAEGWSLRPGRLLPRYPEIFDPVSALLNSRTGRGREAWCRLKQSAGHELIKGGIAAGELEINLENPGGDRIDERIPLTWTVTRQTESVMRKRLCEALANEDFASRLAGAFGEPTPTTHGFVGPLATEAIATTQMTVSPDAKEASILFDDLVVMPATSTGTAEMRRKFVITALPVPEAKGLTLDFRGSAPTSGADLKVRAGDMTYTIQTTGEHGGSPFRDRVTTPLPVECRLEVEITMRLTGADATATPLALDSVDLAFDVQSRRPGE